MVKLATLVETLPGLEVVKNICDTATEQETQTSNKQISLGWTEQNEKKLQRIKNIYGLGISEIILEDGNKFGTLYFLF